MTFDEDDWKDLKRLSLTLEESERVRQIAGKVDLASVDYAPGHTAYPYEDIRWLAARVESASNIAAHLRAKHGARGRGSPFHVEAREKEIADLRAELQRLRCVNGENYRALIIALRERDVEKARPR